MKIRKKTPDQTKIKNPFPENEKKSNKKQQYIQRIYL